MQLLSYWLDKRGYLNFDLIGQRSEPEADRYG
jgi:hypothetical protein